MSDMSLPWVVATVETLQSYGIDTEGLRKDLVGTVTTEGEITRDTHKAIVHLQNLTVEQFNAMRFDVNVEILSYAQVRGLTAGSEWTITVSE